MLACQIDFKDIVSHNWESSGPSLKESSELELSRFLLCSWEILSLCSLMNWERENWDKAIDWYPDHSSLNSHEELLSITHVEEDLRGLSFLVSHLLLSLIVPVDSPIQFCNPLCNHFETTGWRNDHAEEIKILWYCGGVLSPVWWVRDLVLLLTFFVVGLENLAVL